MRSRVLFAGLAVFLVLQPRACRAQAQEHPKARAPVKVDWSADGGELIRVLAELAREQGLNPEDYIGYRSFLPSGALGRYGRFATARRAVSVQAHGGHAFLVVEEHPVAEIPGIAAAQVVLLSPDGRILDRLQCDASSRRVSRVECQILKEPAGDGTQVVVRFARGGFGEGDVNRYPGCAIVLRGREYQFVGGGQGGNERDPRRDGILCRATVSDGKFYVLVPRLEAPEADLRSAELVRISYSAGGEVKMLRITDRQQITALISSLDVARTSDLPGGWARETDTIEFINPHASLIRLAFTSPSELTRDHWGSIALRSTAFYDRICDLVSRAEGKSVQLETYGR
jgi:hypothetical protein